MIREGDIEARWNYWVETQGSKVLLYAKSRTRTLEEAEDVMQESLIRLWKHYRAGKVRYTDLNAAACMNIRRISIDSFRKNERRIQREALSEHASGDQVYFESSLDGDAESKNIETELKLLPAKYREVIVLRIWEELSFKEISKITGESVNSVTSLYRYGLEKLKSRITGAERRLVQ